MSEDPFDFEVRATEFLNKSINIEGVKFKCLGGNNSWDGDISVTFNEEHLFWISAKLQVPQSGQITVIKNDKGLYQLTEGSHDPVKQNSVTQTIIDHLNSDLIYYSKPSSKDIKFLNNDLIIKWLKEQCIIKNERFIIFPNDEDMVILPAVDVDEFFEIIGKFRIKPSGTHHIPKNKMTKEPFYTKHQCIEIAKKYLSSKGFKIIEIDKKKHYVLKLDMPLPNNKFADIRYFDDYFYFGIIRKFPLDTCALNIRSKAENPNPNVMVEMKAKETSFIINDGLFLLRKEIETQIRALNR